MLTINKLIKIIDQDLYHWDSDRNMYDDDLRGEIQYNKLMKESLENTLKILNFLKKVENHYKQQFDVYQNIINERYKENE